MTHAPTAADLFPESATAGGHYVGPRVAASIRARQADPVAALTALADSPSAEALEMALREFALQVGTDQLRRATMRGTAIETLKARKVASPTAMVDAALGVTAQPATGPSSGGALALPEPEPWPVPVDGGQLLTDLATVIRRHVVLTAEQADTVALWVVFAHAIGGARIAPKLAITSPTPRCGKSTLLALIAALVPRPLVASNISPAAVFRVIESAHPTLLVDEADSFLRDNEELRGVLNSGHSRDGAYVIRCVGDNLEARRFSTWCAQAVGLIGSLPATLADRSIEVRLERKRTVEAVAKLTSHAREGLAMLARQAARWAADHPISDTQPEMPGGMNDRAADNWEPLLSIADLVGGAWPERARQPAVALSGGEPADAQAVGAVLLGDIRTIFEQRQADRMASADLVAALAELEDRPWPEWRHGKPMTAPQLARQLRHFGIAPGTIRLPNNATPKGYIAARFEDAWARYLAGPEPPDTPFSPDTPLSNRHTATRPVNTGESGDFASATPEACGGSENAVSPNKDAGCGGVAASNPPAGGKGGNEPPQRDLWGGWEGKL